MDGPFHSVDQCHQLNSSLSTVIFPALSRVQIPLVFHKLRPVASHLSDAELSATVHETDELLSAEEQSLLLTFCRAMGIDTGELDVLRDNGDGRIYVVDANCEPWGPPDYFIDRGQDRDMIALLAPSYQKLFEQFAVPRGRRRAAAGAGA